MSIRHSAGAFRHLSISGAYQEISLAGLFEDRRLHVCLIAAMSLLVLFAKLHLGDLGGYDDAVYAHEGKRMLATGEWWTVNLNGQPDFDKPPMFIWLEALSMKVFGVSDFAARFPSALLGFGSILLVYFITRELTTSYWLPVWAMMILFVWFVSQYQFHGSKFLALHFSFTFDNLPLTNGKGANQFGSGLLRYPLFLIKSYWPWLPLMVAGIWSQTKKAIKERDSTGLFLTLWVLALIVPFSLAEFKWLRYIMPAFPAFAILSAVPLNDWITAHWRRLFLKAAYAVLCLTMVGMALNPKYRVRPEEMRRLAPVAESATIPERKILLYTERLHPDAHVYQIIWYADRYCELLANANEALAKLEREPNAAVIMDKDVFLTSIICEAAASDQTITILGQTERFICWTIDHQHHSEEK